MNSVKDVKSALRSALMHVRRRFGMTPMYRVMEELKRRQVNLAALRALDLFAGRGHLQTMDFASEVSSLEVWEINPDCEEGLKRNLPNARVRIVDSLEEIKRTDKKFDLIVVDAPTKIYGTNGRYCEHFDLFPGLLRISMPTAIIVLNVIPRILKSHSRKARRCNSSYGSEQHLARRGAFYRTSTPEDTPFDHMMAVYEELVRECGFGIDWYFFRKKLGAYYYLVLRVRRSSTAQEGPPRGTHVIVPRLVNSDL